MKFAPPQRKAGYSQQNNTKLNEMLRNTAKYQEIWLNVTTKYAKILKPYHNIIISPKESVKASLH